MTTARKLAVLAASPVGERRSVGTVAQWQRRGSRRAKQGKNKNNPKPHHERKRQKPQAEAAPAEPGFLFPQYEAKANTYARPLMFGELAVLLWLLIMGAKAHYI